MVCKRSIVYLFLRYRCMSAYTYVIDTGSFASSVEPGAHSGLQYWPSGILDIMSLEALDFCSITTSPLISTLLLQYFLLTTYTAFMFPFVNIRADYNFNILAGLKMVNFAIHTLHTLVGSKHIGVITETRDIEIPPYIIIKREAE